MHGIVNLLLFATVLLFHSSHALKHPANALLVYTGFNFTIAGSDYGDGSVETILQSLNATFELQFGTLPGQASSHGLGVVHTESTFIVWFTYRDDTLGQYDALGGSSTTLMLQQDGDLVITVDGEEDVHVLVWNSKTAGKGVVAMRLLEDGNLVLLNSTNRYVWQSFDHPTDTLLSGQRLEQGMQLQAAAQNGYPFKGKNTLSVQSDRVVAYVTYLEPEPYWELRTPSNQLVSYAAIVNGRFSLMDDRDKLIIATFANSSTQGLHRLTLDKDGNPRIYLYTSIAKAWSPTTQFIDQACKLPDDCGSYGQCVTGQACSCPPTFNLLATLNGCVPPQAFDCTTSHSNDFIKVPYTSYFAIPLQRTLPILTFEACKTMCTSNCSCLGFFYAASADRSRPCHLTYQLRTFTSNVYLNYTPEFSYDLYVRVQGKAHPPIAIIAGICVPIVVIAFCLLLWKFVQFRVKVAKTEEEEFLLEALPGLPPRFSYKELKIATRNFEKKLGAGASGSVYEGVLPDDTKIAVKQLASAIQGKKEFHAEVATIGSIRHVNLVRLRGFCLEREHRLLVYEHMSRSSLDRVLFSGEEKLSWEERFGIALGVARGLAYLHEDCPECIIHCDVKLANILVDDVGVAKLSDFGLSKIMSRQQSSSFTNMRGTRGYLAPEWLLNTAITEKTDVYSYGVVLLEIISGHRNSELDVSSWAIIRFYTSHLEELIQDFLENGILDHSPNQLEELKLALKVALWCIREDPSMRPSMSRVVRMLERDVEVPPLPFIQE